MEFPENTPNSVNAEFVRGVTLDRIQILKTNGDKILCSVRRISDDDFVGKCDACNKRHQDINVYCSKTNRKSTSWAKDFQLLYRLRGKPVYKILAELDTSFEYSNGRVKSRGYTLFKVKHVGPANNNEG